MRVIIHLLRVKEIFNRHMKHKYFFKIIAAGALVIVLINANSCNSLHNTSFAYQYNCDMLYHDSISLLELNFYGHNTGSIMFSDSTLSIFKYKKTRYRIGHTDLYHLDITEAEETTDILNLHKGSWRINIYYNDSTLYLYEEPLPQTRKAFYFLQQNVDDDVSRLYKHIKGKHIKFVAPAKIVHKKINTSDIYIFPDAYPYDDFSMRTNGYTLKNEDIELLETIISNKTHLITTTCQNINQPLSTGFDRQYISFIDDNEDIIVNIYFIKKNMYSNYHLSHEIIREPYDLYAKYYNTIKITINLNTKEILQIIEL